MATRIELKGNPPRRIPVNDSPEEVQRKLNDAAADGGEPYVRFDGKGGEVVVKASDVALVQSVADKPKPR